VRAAVAGILPELPAAATEAAPARRRGGSPGRIGRRFNPWHPHADCYDGASAAAGPGNRHTARTGPSLLESV